MKDIIDKYVAETVIKMHKKKDEELSALLDSCSPLLSLGNTHLSKIMEYLDEDGLYQAEAASFTLNEFISCGDFLGGLNTDRFDAAYEELSLIENDSLDIVRQSNCKSRQGHKRILVTSPTCSLYWSNGRNSTTVGVHWRRTL